MAERQRAEEKLRHSERLAAMGIAATRLAHEISNPLNGISTTVQVLDRYLSKRPDIVDETLTTTVYDLKNEIHRLQSLLQQWRALARPQQLNLQPTSLAELTAEVLRVQAPFYEAQAIHVEQAVPAALPPVMVDREKLAQILLNLCKNAVEAMPQGGTLTLRGFNTGAQVALTISDTGGGIPAGLDIFEPFTTTKASGTGLGLAIVQQLVAAHGGTIGYVSTPKVGTTFTLMLPVIRRDKRQSY
jgi:signal transduction histidine kinase